VRRIANFAVAFTFVCSTFFVLSSPAWGDAATEKSERASVQAVASDQSSLDALPVDTGTVAGKACDGSNSQDAACKLVHLLVTDNVVKDQLKQLHKGDYVQVVYSTELEKNVLKALRTYDVSAVDSPFWVLLASAAVCLLLYSIFSGFKPLQLIISEDNRYSNSRFQMTLWFFVLITSYIAMLWLRLRSAGWDFIGGVDIPKNLLLLSGLSALTFAGAKGITASRVAPAGAAVKPPAAAPNFFHDLTHNDVGQFDFGDFQMLVIALIAVVTYTFLIFNFLGTIEYLKVVNLPDVDTTILATFGLGQGAYLTKKAVGNVGTS
jgi:hypothetical protein